MDAIIRVKGTLGSAPLICSFRVSIFLLSCLHLAGLSETSPTGPWQIGERHGARVGSPDGLSREAPEAESMGAAGGALYGEVQNSSSTDQPFERRDLRELLAALRKAPRSAQGPTVKWGPAGWTLVWPKVNVTTLGGPSNFGWVESAASLANPAVVGQQTCAWLALKDRAGKAFENGTQQRAYLAGRVSQGDIVLPAQFWYLPAWGTHKMCFTLPTPGLFTVRVQLGFVNYYEYVARIDPANVDGFAGYPSILSTVVNGTANATASAAAPAGGAPRSGAGPPPPRPAANASASFEQSRAKLPLCTLASLAQSGNGGFWKGNSWYPQSCRLAQLSQSDIFKCLNGKSVLIIGDSEVRILFGLLQDYLRYNSRSDFLDVYSRIPRSMGDLLGNFKLPLTTSEGGEGPPLIKGTTRAVKTQYDYLDANTTFYGGIYQGFTVRHLSMKTASNKLVGRFSMTYSSFFNASQKLFSQWKLTGQQSEGVKVTDGGSPFDSVVMATQIHDTYFFENATFYRKAVTTNLLPSLQPYLKNRTSLVMYGGLAGIESRRKGSSALQFAGNPRAAAFETMGRQILRNWGYPHFLPIQQMTAVRPDLAVDSIHYNWQVTLAMIDLWLGGTCPSLGQAF